MDIHDDELVSRLRRLGATPVEARPGFDYPGLLSRQAAGQARARRRTRIARGVAGGLILAVVGLSAWRLDPSPEAARAPAPTLANDLAPEPRLVRADTWLALAALEDHIATIDDALTDARLRQVGHAEVARLERTRAELVDSYASVRYADLVSTHF